LKYDGGGDGENRRDVENDEGRLKYEDDVVFFS
jgi:hypothetical protein